MSFAKHFKVKMSKSKYSPNYNILHFQPISSNFYYPTGSYRCLLENSNHHTSFDMVLEIEISLTNYTPNYNILQIEQLLKPLNSHRHH